MSDETAAAEVESVLPAEDTTEQHPQFTEADEAREAAPDPLDAGESLSADSMVSVHYFRGWQTPGHTLTEPRLEGGGTFVVGDRAITLPAAPDRARLAQISPRPGCIVRYEVVSPGSPATEADLTSPVAHAPLVVAIEPGWALSLLESA